MKLVNKIEPADAKTTATGPATGGNKPPLRPVIGSEADWKSYDQQMKNLGKEASDAGTYHAARGSADKRVNLQQRMRRALKGNINEE
jgi:hypothetical protein